MTDTDAQCRCGKPHDDWPADDSGKLCQDCWEVDCSKSWWLMIGQLATIGSEAVTGD